MKCDDYQVIFTDIDGTLLNGVHRMTPATVEALCRWTKKGRMLVLTSSRGVSGIEPICRRYGLKCWMIALGGALILDEDRQVVFERGMSAQEAAAVTDFIKEKRMPAVWGVYTARRWVVNDLQHKAIRKEADIVEADPTGDDLRAIGAGEKVGKVLMICEPGTIDGIESQMKERFPGFSITRSSDLLLEVNPAGITKAGAVKEFCRMNGIAPERAIAFGDNYNDLSMLNIVGCPIVMGNAPEEIRGMFDTITDDNEHDGIAKALEPEGFYG